MEPGIDLYLIFAVPLNRAGLKYMVTGSAAAMVYGEVRLTHDVGIVMELVPGDVPQIRELFPAGDFYCPDAEVLRREIAHEGRGQFNVIHQETGFKADFYVSGRGGLHGWGFEHRESIDVRGERVWIAPVEYVIIKKLMYFREGGSEKHLREIAMMLRISPERIDRLILERLAPENGVVDEWKRIGGR
jgi:hypothetical protein